MTSLLTGAVLSASVMTGLAACSGQSKTVEVSGTATCVSATVVPNQWEYGFDCRTSMSDERVNGDVTVYGTQSSDGTAISGVYTLINGKGSWVGNWEGVIKADGTHVIDGVYFGSGEYEGWMFKSHSEHTDVSKTTVTGTLVPPSE